MLYATECPWVCQAWVPDTSCCPWWRRSPSNSPFCAVLLRFQQKTLPLRPHSKNIWNILNQEMEYAVCICTHNLESEVNYYKVCEKHCDKATICLDAAPTIGACLRKRLNATRHVEHAPVSVCSSDGKEEHLRREHHRDAWLFFQQIYITTAQGASASNSLAAPRYHRAGSA
jgi:hypothetical protein